MAAGLKEGVTQRTSERRLARLIQDVRDRLRKGEGQQAGRNAVLALAKAESITELSAALGESRSDTSACLGAMDGRPFHRIRRRLDEHLELPTGGMERVLGLVEEKVAGKPQRNGRR